MVDIIEQSDYIFHRNGQLPVCKPNNKSICEKAYEVLMSSYAFLLWLGGMPAVVDAFRADKDYIEVRQIQSDILRQ